METVLSTDPMGHIGVLTISEDGVYHRRVIMPGNIRNGGWLPIDLSEETQEIQDYCNSVWTQDFLVQYQAGAMQRYLDNLPPPPSTDPNDYTLNRFQFEGMLLAMGVTFSQIEQAIGASKMSDMEKAFAISRLRNTDSYHRDHQLISMLGPVFKLTPEAIDTAWMQAKDIQ